MKRNQMSLIIGEFLNFFKKLSKMLVLKIMKATSWVEETHKKKAFYITITSIICCSEIILKLVKKKAS